MSGRGKLHHWREVMDFLVDNNFRARFLFWAGCGRNNLSSGKGR